MRWLRSLDHRPFNCASFYRAMLCVARTMPPQAVCLSVTRRRCPVETAKRILKLFSPSGSHTILFYFNTKRYDNTPMPPAPNGGVECREVGKICDFRPMSYFISGMIQDKAIVTMEGTCMGNCIPKLTNDTISNDLELPWVKLSDLAKYSVTWSTFSLSATAELFVVTVSATSSRRYASQSLRH